MALHSARSGFVWRAVLHCVLGSIGLLATSAAFAQSDPTPVIFSFATVGDNRQDPAKADPTTFLANSNPTTEGGIYSASGGVLPQDQIFLQNSAAWSEIQAGITAQGAQLLFFNGDMIYGYGRPSMPAAWTGNPVTWLGQETLYPDAFFEYIQYAFWRGTVSTLFNNGTYVIPVPGNHETQCNATSAPYSKAGTGLPGPNPQCSTTTNGGKQAWADNENAFRANMQDLIQDLVSNLRFSNVSGVFATNLTGVTTASAVGPGATVCTTPGVTSNTCSYSAGNTANNGPVTGTQEYLDYSFDVLLANSGGSPLLMHFAVINTDPSGSDETPPADWLAGDFLAASNRASAGNYSILYFVFGHKPAFTYNYIGNSPPVAAGGLDANASLTYRNLFWSTIAQYGATYFSGHEHIPNVQPFADPTGVSTNTPYQVLVGSGGSPFDDAITAAQASAGTEPPEAASTDRYYAWALVEVHQDGNVTLHLSGFPDTAIGGPLHDLTNYDIPGPTLGNGYLQTAATPAQQAVVRSTVTETPAKPKKR